MMEPYETDLRALQMAADLICDVANPHDFRESINWGDLGCVAAESFRMLSEDGDERAGLRVWIEEADPGCSEFCEYVADELQRRGFGLVEVRTEW